MTEPDDPTLPPPGGDDTRPDSIPPLPTGAAPGDEDMTLVHKPGGAAEEAPTIVTRPGGGETAADPAGPGLTDTVQLSAGDAQTQVFADRFEVVGLLGEGGMGRVYQVRDRQVEGREVALKVLRPRYSRNAKFRQLFFQEIDAAQKFVSEYVNQVRDTGQMEDGRLFLTMDLVEGEALNDLLARENALNTRHALEVTRQMLIALGSGHERGFVHRDVKPSNVMLAQRVSKTDDNPYGVGVRLLDFGIAALAADVGEGRVSGTPMYMSPEQAQGQRLDARSDLFSVGIVLYEMLSGSRPFEGTTLEEVSTSLVETKVAPMVKGLDHLKPAVQKILSHALEKDRDKRYQSAAEFIAAIEGSKAYRPPTGVPAWVGGLLVLSLVGNAGGGAWIAYQTTLLNDAQKSLQTKTDELAAARDGASRERDQAGVSLTASLQEQEKAFRAEIDSRETTIASLRAQITGLQGQLTDEGDDEVREGVTSDVLRDQVEELRQQVKELTTKYEESEQEKLELRLKTEPDARAAAGFDDVLHLIENGFADDAKRAYAVLEQDSVFARGGGGGDFVGRVVDVAADVDAYRAATADGPSAAALTRIRRGLDGLRKSTEPFAIESRRWIDTRLPQAPEPMRLERLTTLLDRLDSEVTSFEDALELDVIESSTEIIEGPPTQDPEVVIEYGNQDPAHWTRLSLFFGRLGDYLRGAEVDGRLDLAALRDRRVVDGWYDHVTSGGAGVPARVAEDLRWLWFARQWYLEGQDVTIPEALASRGIESAAPHDDWRAELVLQTRLSADCGWPTRGSREVIHQTTPTTGSVSWTIDSVAGTIVVGSGTDWSITRRLFIQVGDEVSSTRQLTLGAERRGSEWFGTDGALLVDFRDTGEDVRVGLLDVDLPEELPDKYGFPDEKSWERFRKRISASSPLACLVVSGGDGIVRWFAPGFGLVHEEIRGRVRQLVYLEE